MQNKAKILDKFSDLVGRTVKSVLIDRYAVYMCIWFEDGSCCLPIPEHDSSKGSFVGLCFDTDYWDYETTYDLGFMDEQEYLVLKAKEEAEIEAQSKEFRREQWETLNKEFGTK